MAADLRSCPLVKLGHLPASEALSADGHVGDQTVLIKRPDSPEEASRAKGFRGKHYLVPVVALVMLAGFGGYFLRAKAPAPQASLPTASSLAEEVWQVQKGNETEAPPSATGERAAAEMSLIESAKLNGHDPYAYLRDVLERLPTHKASQIGELLPHRWKAR